MECDSTDDVGIFLCYAKSTYLRAKHDPTVVEMVKELDWEAFEPALT